MKSLIYVPIIHTIADLGSLAKDVVKRGISDLGQDLWELHRKTVDGFWDAISYYFDSIDVSGMKLYQDGMVADGEIGQEIVDAGVKSGSKNYELVSRLIKRSATLVKTEDFKLVKEERDRLLSMTEAKSIARRFKAFLIYKLNENRLLRKRDKFIASRINETLKEGERGIIFIGAYHDIKKRLPKDIQIKEIKNATRVKEYHKLLPLYNKNKKRFEELAKYLVSEIDKKAPGTHYCGEPNFKKDQCILREMPKLITRIRQNYSPFFEKPRMRNKNGIREQLAEGVQELRHKIAELETAEALHGQAEESLRESENRYRFLVDNSKEIILILNKRGKIVFANKSTMKNYGYSEGELVGKSITRFLTEDSIKKAQFALAQEFSGRPQPETEVKARAKSGEIRYLKVARGSIPVYKSGKLTGMLISAADVTEIKKAEEKLRESEKRFKELWNDAPVAYHILDTQGIIQEVNKTEAQMLGYNKEEMEGKPIFDFVLPEQREEARERFEKKLSGKFVPKAEKRMYVKKNGSKIYVDISDVLERDSDGKIIGVRTTMVDITERKKAEEKIQSTIEMLKKAMEGTVQAISTIVEIRDPYTAGHQRRVAALSRAIAQEMSLLKDQVNGIRIAALIHDIGKTSIPAEIINKPGKLTETELNMIRNHVRFGFEVLKSIEFPWPVAQIVLHHHERIDGSGYPAGLTDKEILVEAKILGVADVVEAMLSHRPYRPAHGIDKTLEEISNNKGVLYDPDVVDACLNLIKKKGFKFREEADLSASLV